MIINQTGGGQTPTGTTQITSNGTHNVAGYEFADVNVPTTAPQRYLEFEVDANGVLQHSTTATNVIDLSGATSISGYNVLYNAYYNNTAISGAVDLSSLTTVSGNSACFAMFQGCTGLTSVDLSSLTTIGGQSSCAYMFSGCTGLTSVDLSSLTRASANSSCQYMFSGCVGLTNIDLSSLVYVQQSACSSMFQGCTGLTSVDLRSLKSFSGQQGCYSMFEGCIGLTNIDFCSIDSISPSKTLGNAFKGCTSLQRVSFYALDTTSFGTSYANQFNSMLSGCSNVTVHFPMRIQSTIGSWSDVTAGFGGTNTTVLFDIVCTLTGADSNTYTRQQKDSTSTATAWDLGGVLYYTSGTAEPVVNDTIYSDAGCTQVVTTVAAIA